MGAVVIEYHPELLESLAELYSQYADPSMGLNPFPVEHWESLFIRPELDPRRDVLIISDRDNPSDPSGASFSWLYSKHAPSHIYLRGPYHSPNHPHVERLLDEMLLEVQKRAEEYRAGHIEGRSLYKQWEEAYIRAGFQRMGAYERWRLFPLKGSVPVHDAPEGGYIRKWQGMGDIEILMRLFAESFGEHWDYVPPRRSDYEEIFRGRQFSPELLYTGYEGESPVCFIFGEGMYDYTLPTLNAAYLVSIAVNSESRTRGWGRALLSRWLRAVYQSGGRAVELDVDTDNESAKALYEGFGFRCMRTEHVWRKYLR